MRIRPTFFLIASVLCIQAQASEIDQTTASRFVTTFYQAMQKHDLATVSRMMDNRAVIKVIWMQADPPQTFTLSKADYLQQLKATWHFAAKESYEIKNLTINIVNGMTVVSLQQTENRILFGNKSGQSNDLKMTISSDSSNPRIIAINSKMKLW